MNAEQSGLTCLVYALMTVSMWGVCGVFLHSGQIHMADSVNGHYKAFLLVGIAYCLTAVLAPLIFLKVNGTTWGFPVGGMTWSPLLETCWVSNRNMPKGHFPSSRRLFPEMDPGGSR